jgi:hypothetical protein
VDGRQGQHLVGRAATASSPERSFSRVTSARKVLTVGIAVGEQGELLQVLEARAGVLEVTAGP